MSVVERMVTSDPHRECRARTEKVRVGGLAQIKAARYLVSVYERRLEHLRELACVDDNAELEEFITRRRGDGVGTRRRLQALVAMGWSQSEIARRLGVDPANATKLFRCVLVHAVTARRVAGLYDELSMTHGGSRRALNVAAREGWLRPLDWDDDLIDGPEHFRWARTSTGRRWAA